MTAARRRRTTRVISLLVAGVLLVLAGGAVTLWSEQAQAVQTPTSCGGVVLVNGDFEQPVMASTNTFVYYNDSTVPGWRTTAPDHNIEYQNTTGLAYSGVQFAELNASQPSTLYQDVATTPGQTLRWELRHRGRSGTDTMAVDIGAPGATLVRQAVLSDPRTAWGRHTGLYIVPAGQTTTRVGFSSVSTATGAAHVGNLLDAVSFGTGACLVTTAQVAPSGRARVGDVLTYTVSATNGGGNPAVDTALSDGLPAGVSFVPGSIRSVTGVTTSVVTDAGSDDAGEYDPVTRTVRVRVGAGADATAGGTVLPAETRSIRYQVRVDRAGALSTVTNDAAAEYTDPLAGAGMSSTSDTVSTPVDDAADLTAALVQQTATLVAGRPVTYRADVTSSGPGTSSDTTLTTQLPAGLTGITAAPSSGSCATIAPGATSATVTWSTATAGSSSVDYGRSATSLTSSATGAGGTTQHSVTLTGLVPGAVYHYRVTSVDGDGTTTVTPAAPAAPATFTHPATVGANTAQGVPVTASSSVESTPWGRARAVDGITSSGGSSNGWTSGDNTSMDHTEWFQLDLGSSRPVSRVTLWPRNDSGNVGYGYPVSGSIATSVDGITWTPSAAIGSATLPTGAQTVSFDSQTGRYLRVTGTSLRPNPADSNRYRMQFAEVEVHPTVPATTTTVSCSIGTVPDGGGGSVTITGTVPADAAPGTQYAVSIVAAGDLYDHVPGDNAASVSDSITASADLGVTLTHSPATPTAGTDVTYTATITNAGPSTARSIVLSDPVPTGSTDPRASVPGGTCTVTSTNAIECRVPDLAVGASTVVTVTMRLSPGGGGQVGNAVAVVAATPDPQTADNSVSVSSPGNARADLSILLSVGATSGYPGDRIPYTLTVVNRGPSTATNVSFSTTLPPGLTIERVANPFCTATACTIPSLAPYDPSTTPPTGVIRISGFAVAVADAEEGPGRASTTVISPMDDPDRTNNTQAVDFEVLLSADLSVTQTFVNPAPPAGGSPGAAIAGGPVRATAVVGNAGPTRAEGLLLQQAIPAGQPLPVVVPSAGTCTFQGDVADGISVDGGSVVCSLDVLQASATWSIQFDTRLPAAFAESTFQRTRMLSSASPDPVPGDNTVTGGIPVVHLSGLSLTQTTSTPTVVQTEAVAFQLTLTNVGPSDARDVVVRQTTETGLVLDSGTPGAGTYNGGPGEWRVPHLAAGTSVRLDLTGTAQASGTSSATATIVGSASRDPDAADDSASALFTVIPAVRSLAIASTATVTPPAGQRAARMGDTIAYTYVITNDGNVAMDGIAVTDATSGRPVTCPQTRLEAGSSMTCSGTGTHTVTQGDVDSGRDVVATVFVAGLGAGAGTAETFGPVTVAVPVAPVSSALQATQDVDWTDTDTDSDGALDVGERIEWTATVTNTGLVTLRGLLLADPVSSRMTCLATVLAPGARTTCSGPPHVVTAADVASGLVVHTVVASATEPRAGARVSSSPSTVSVPRSARPLLSLTVSGTVSDTGRDSGADIGDTVRWTHTVTNQGNVPIVGVGVEQVGGATCDVSVLLLGESAGCRSRVPQEVLEADVLSGAATITGRATGRWADGLQDVVGAPATGSVRTVPPRPGISLTTAFVPVSSGALLVETPATSAGVGPAPGRSAAAAVAGPVLRVAVGDLVQVRYTAHNTGNVTLSGISLTDPDFGVVSCERTVLSPRAAMGCTADVLHRISAADLARGFLLNHPVVRGDSPVGVGTASVSGSASVQVDLVARLVAPPGPVGGPYPPSTPGPATSGPPGSRSGGDARTSTSWTDGLASTGAVVLRMLVAGAALVAAGGVVLLVMRRRRPPASDTDGA